MSRELIVVFTIIGSGLVGYGSNSASVGFGIFILMMILAIRGD